MFCLCITVTYVRAIANAPSFSRVALKKYVKANNNINATDKMFDSLFNKALKSGVEKGEFNQPKGKLSEFATIDVASYSRPPSAT